MPIFWLLAGYWGWATHTAALAAMAFLWPGADDCTSANPIPLVACQFDSLRYAFFESLASTIWQIDRMLLGGSYWMDALRDQFVQTIFAGAYAALTAAIGPLLGPMAMLALVLGALALIALPITGTSGPLNIRMILLWTVFGPLLLTLSGPYLAQFEQFRTELGAQLFSSVAGQALALGADTAHDMATPRQLYPSDACGADAAGQPALRRFSQSMQPNVDEQVAALVWANAKDLHCPDRLLPMAFYQDGTDGPGYLSYGGIRSLSEQERQRYLNGAQAAINRLLLAMLPALVALLIALLNFVFACCAMLLWFAIPLGVLFGFFQANTHWFTSLVQRAAGILRTSWTISILLGIFSSLLLSAGMAGDALRYSMLTIISGIFVARFVFTAFGLFAEALTTMSAVAGLGAGPSLGQLAGGAAGMAAGVATGGVGAALTMAMAAKQTGSRRYALAAAAGRFRPLMQLGEVAASMGLGGDELSSGLSAGQRSLGGLRAGRMAIQADARRKDAEGMTFRERAADRKQAHAIRRADAGNLWQRSVREPQRLRQGAQQVNRAVEAMRAAIADPSVPATRALDYGRRTVRRAQAAVARQIIPQQHQYAALALDGVHLRHLPRVATADLPAHARDEHLTPLRMRALMREGYLVQRNDNGTVTYWHPQPPDEPAAAPHQNHHDKGTNAHA